MRGSNSSLGNFNSYMVRLEVDYLDSLLKAITEFQFLYGTIRGGSLLKAKQDILDFNSYMVRLEAVV